jgi:hypothetical protein
MELISEKKLKEFGTDYVKILVRELKRDKKVATTVLINSVDYRIRKEAKEISIIIDSVDYLKFVDEGRKPGKYPPLRAIENWVDVKGISSEMVWPIMQSIYKFGIKPTNVIQRVVTEFETSQTLKNKYEEEVVNQIITQVNHNFKNLNEKYK